MRTVALSDGKRVPVLGQGTWRMGESKSARAREVAALRLGIELGINLINTTEMYGDGGAEEIVAEAIHGQRQGVFVVTKVIRIIHHARNCQKLVSAVSSASASTRLIFIFCTGASERRHSKKLLKRSRSCALPEKLNAGVSQTSTSTTWRNCCRWNTVANVPQIRFCTISRIAKSSSIFCHGDKRTRSRSWHIRLLVTAASCSETQR